MLVLLQRHSAKRKHAQLTSYIYPRYTRRRSPFEVPRTLNVTLDPRTIYDAAANVTRSILRHQLRCEDTPHFWGIHSLSHSGAPPGMLHRSRVQVQSSGSTSAGSSGVRLRSSSNSSDIFPGLICTLMFMHRFVNGSQITFWICFQSSPHLRRWLPQPSDVNK